MKGCHPERQIHGAEDVVQYTRGVEALRSLEKQRELFKLRSAGVG
jgi:hypothetical protein